MIIWLSKIWLLCSAIVARIRFFILKGKQQNKKIAQFGTDPVKVLGRVIETRMQMRGASKKRLQ